MVASGGKQRNGEIFLHLVEETSVLPSFRVADQVTNVNGKGYLLVMVNILQEWLKKGVVPFIVSKYGEYEIVRMSNLDPRNLPFVPVMNRQWSMGLPELEA